MFRLFLEVTVLYPPLPQRSGLPVFISRLLVLTVLGELVTRHGVGVTFREARRQRPLPVSPGPVGRLLCCFLHDFRATNSTRNVPAREEVVATGRVFGHLCVSLSCSNRYWRVVRRLLLF